MLALCQQLAAAARVPLAERGSPEQLHEGFWYDDGPQHFAPPELAEEARQAAEVQPYCSSLGFPVPAPSTANLALEAAQWRALSVSAVDQVLPLLRPWQSGLAGQELGASLIERLGLPAAERLAREHSDLQPLVLAWLARTQPERIPQVAATFPEVDAHDVQQALYALSPSPRLALSLLEAGERTMRQRQRPHDHGLAHLTFWDLGASLALTPIGTLLELCDRLEVLWDWFTAVQTTCQPCRDSGVDAVRRAARRSYAREPDPRRVLACLRSRRAGSLAQRTALHLAAAFVLAEDAPPPAHRRQASDDRGAPDGLRAVQGLAARNPQLLMEPEFFAALLRQAPRPIRLELPTPLHSPFADLADLLREPEVRQLVSAQGAPYLRGPHDLALHQAAPWEGSWALYFHRRSETPLRKRVAQLALSQAG